MKDDLVFIDHMLECIRRIEEYTASGKDAFLASTLIQDAVIRNLQVLAESSKRISERARERSSDVPWRQIAGFRNVAVHEYLYIDLGYVWEIVSIDIPELRAKLTILRDTLVGTA